MNYLIKFRKITVDLLSMIALIFLMWSMLFLYYKYLNGFWEFMGKLIDKLLI